jgi:hypothetical protein
MNDLVKKKESSDLVSEDYGDRETALQDFINDIYDSPFVGTLLRFKDGDFLYRVSDGEREAEREIEEGTELVVSVDSLEHGWVKWIDQRPVERKMGLVVEHFRAPARPELGDMDKDMWPRDKDDKPIDPWQRTVHVVMYDRTRDADSDGALFTFTTSSYGGRQAIQGLAKQAKKHMDQNPVVRLESNAYTHSRLGYRIKRPVFKIVNWEQK